ncbi:MAG: acetylxylan esterase, partial [Verrucomicrobia bacterium]|nr:acetylxylan esterase [Verrucomicrobiota bacterium]
AHARFHPNYDESKVGTYTLPDPLLMSDGRRVANTNQWLALRRPEILSLYKEYIYGKSPPACKAVARVWDVDTHALGGHAIRKQINIELFSPISTNRVVLHVLLYTPADKERAPTFLCLSFDPNYRDVPDPLVAVYPTWNRKTDKLVPPPRKVVRGKSHNWPVNEIIADGYGIALVDYNDIEPDFADGSGWRYGVRALFLKPGQAPNAVPDAWGAISAWAWGASRILDYLLTDTNVDPARVIMLGHSRLGKTALWEGAQDSRFPLVIASSSGEMGASLSRRNYGETVTSMSKAFPYQFCPNFLQWSNRIPSMPVDSHMLVSLIAPRPLYLNTGSLDQWSDPRGEFEAAIAAGPVYRLFGEETVVSNLPPGNAVLNSSVLESFPPPPLDVPVMHDIGFQTHTGKHDILPQDWRRFLDFADMHFYGKQPHRYLPRK